MRALLFSFLCGLAPVLPAGAADQLRVVSFSTVLTEIAEQLAGAHAKVTGLVIAGEDPHEYQPTPADLDQVSQANLVLLSGKHIEHYLDKIQQATGGKVDSLSVGDQLPSLQLKPNPEDYGFTIYAIEGVSTDTEPSNRHVAELIDEIKKQGVKAIFLESTLNPKVTSEITRETGVRLGGTRYADGLGTGPASTYDGMFRLNVSTIVNALK